MKAAAIALAKSGVHVFPLRPNGKEPVCTRGFYDATTDLEEIEDAWGQVPDANIGIATGASGLVVFDIDVKGDDDGWDAFDGCVHRFGELPGPTRMASTPSGGAHIYFRTPEGAEVPSSNRQFRNGLETPGLDVRASTGYVVAPPSIIDGKRYGWDITAPAQELPDPWVQAMLPPPPRIVAPENRPVIGRANAYGAKVLDAEADEVAKAVKGTRNNTVTRCAFRVGTIADQCGISGEQAETTFAWAVGQWGDDAEARKARGSFWRAFQAGRDNPRKMELRNHG